MTTQIRILSAASLVLLVACSSSGTGGSTPTAKGQQALTLATPVVEAGDVYAARLMTDVPLMREVSRVPLKASWALPAGQPVAERPPVHVAESRGFWLRVTREELAAGVTLPITAPGPALKITPLGRTSITAEHLQITDNLGRTRAFQDAVALRVSAAELQKVGVDVRLADWAVRVKPELGAGSLKLQLQPGAARGFEGKVLIEVLEKRSPVALKLEAHDAYLRGEALAATARFEVTSGGRVTSEQLSAWVLLPSGAKVPAAIDQDGRVTYALDHNNVVPGVPVTVYVDAVGRLPGGQTVRRTVSTAMAYGLPTARLKTALGVRQDGAGVHFEFDVEVASPGRYAVTGILFGTAANGTLRPMAIGQSAKFIEGTSGRIELTIDRHLITGSGLAAPFELRNVRLEDQSRIALLQRQAFGVRLATLPASTHLSK